MKEDLERAKKVHDVLESVIVFLVEAYEQTSYEPLKTVYIRITDGVDLLINTPCNDKNCEMTAEDVNGMFESLDDLSNEIKCLEMELMLSESENTQEDS